MTDKGRPDPGSLIRMGVDNPGFTRQLAMILRSFGDGPTGPIGPTGLPGSSTSKTIVGPTGATGTCESCGLVVCPTLIFGCSVVGTVSSPKTATITNQSSLTQTVTNVLSTGVGFNFTLPTLPFTIAPGASQEIPVTFTASGAGLFYAQMIVESTAVSSPDYLAMAGLGCVEEPSLVVTPPSIVFQPTPHDACCCSRQEQVNITNNGNTSVPVTGFSITPGDGRFPVSDSFTVLRANGTTEILYLPFTLGPGDVAQAFLIFCPPSTIGNVTFSGFATITTGIGTYFIPLSGPAICVTASVVPLVTSVNFGAHKKSAGITIPVSFRVITSACPNRTSGLGVTNFNVGPPWNPDSISGDLGAPGCNGNTGIVTAQIGFPGTLDPGDYSTDYQLTVTDYCPIGHEFYSGVVHFTGTILPE